MSTTSPELIKNINQDYLNLTEDIEILQNQIRIFESREIWTGVKLSKLFNHQELIRLHLFSNLSVPDEFDITAHSNGNYQILKDDNLLYSFNICPHRIYTPIDDFRMKNMEISTRKCTDCLYC